MKNIALPICNEEEYCAIWLELMDKNTQKLEILKWAHKFHFEWFEVYKKARARNNQIKWPLCRTKIKF